MKNDSMNVNKNDTIHFSFNNKGKTLKAKVISVNKESVWAEDALGSFLVFFDEITKVENA